MSALLEPVPTQTPFDVRNDRILRSARYLLFPLAISMPVMEANGTDEIEEPPLMSGFKFETESGLVEAPFTIDSGALSQSIQTYDPTPGGRARWRITVPETGFYIVTALVNAPSTSENSFFIDWDKESYPVRWDIPVTTGFESRTARWPGEGKPDRLWEYFGSEDVDNLYAKPPSRAACGVGGCGVVKQATSQNESGRG